MEKLEKKMYELMYQSNNFRSVNDECRELANEVKDIAIAFAYFYVGQMGSLNTMESTDEELFKWFIQTYYSPTPEV